ncbi:hypothetical protein Ancab_008208 [Ancistrocladus abbreviatus]
MLVQRVSRGKVEHKETAESSRCAGEQAFQKPDGSSGDTPLRILFQRQKKLKKHCIHKKSPSLQTSDREGKEYRAASVRPTPVGLANTEEGIVLTRGALAHSTHKPSAQGVSAPRENTSKMQQLSQISFFTLPRNREKLSMLRGVQQIPSVKNKKRRSTDLSGSFSSRQIKTDNNSERTSIGDSSIANMNKLICRQQEEMEAQQIWEFGKRFGAHTGGTEEEVVEKIQELEERDRKNCVKLMAASQNINAGRREVSIE